MSSAYIMTSSSPPSTLMESFCFKSNLKLLLFPCEAPEMFSWTTKLSEMLL